jgi:hypothetical protein
MHPMAFLDPGAFLGPILSPACRLSLGIDPLVRSTRVHRGSGSTDLCSTRLFTDDSLAEE